MALSMCANKHGAAGLMLLCAAGLSGCAGESKLVLDGQMKTELKGELATIIKLEGPIQLQMQVQGPTVKYEGVFISEKLLDRVKIGETREDWLLAVFGEPTGRAPLDDGGEIWKWAYRPLEQVGSVVSVFGGSGKDEPKQQPATAFVRLRGRVAIETWRD